MADLAAHYNINTVAGVFKAYQAQFTPEQWGQISMAFQVLRLAAGQLNTSDDPEESNVD